MNKFMMVFDKTLADIYKSDRSFLFMNESKLNGQTVWNFSVRNKELKFEVFDKKKVVFTNRLNF